MKNPSTTNKHLSSPWVSLGAFILFVLVLLVASCKGGGGSSPTPTPDPSPTPPPAGDDMTVMPPATQPPVPQGQPDLFIESTSVSDSTLTSGQQFTLRVTIRNRGDVRAAATTLRYKSDPVLPIISGDTTIGTDSVSSLSPSATSSESISLTAPSNTGTYYYGACVDSVSGESITSNNCSGNQGVRVTVSSSGGGSPGGGSPGGGESPGITFRVTDACNDGYDMNYRFFANDAGSDVIGVWPEAGRVYVTRGLGETHTHTLACTSETVKICYGARRESSSRDNSYWGVGLDGDEGCSDCCNSCPTSGVTTPRERRLTCG